MDIGVGSFVAASALTLGVRRAARAGTARSRSGAMQTLVLAALGVLRLVTTSGINYQSHASEYGIHWNFFFTLCALRGLQWALDRAGVCQTPGTRGECAGGRDGREHDFIRLRRVASCMR